MVKKEYLEYIKPSMTDYDGYLKYLKIGQVSRGTRINTLKIGINEFLRLNEAVGKIDILGRGYVPESFVTESRIGRHPFHTAGLIYSQEPSAAIVAGALRGFIGRRVLDMCAAPGGKATQAAAMMGGEGILIANEINYARAKILRGNLERLGVKNAVTLNETPENIANKFRAYFDTIIVDAPCSGEGMLLKEPMAGEQWSEQYVKECADRQLGILFSADEALCKGGVISYSTCTFNTMENECVVRRFLSERDYEMINIDGFEECDRGIDMKEAIRIYPHRQTGSGHFVCLLRKKSGEKSGLIARKDELMLEKTEDKRIISELAVIGDVHAKSIVKYGGGVYGWCGEPIMKGVNILSFGVKLFDEEKGRLVPHHALAMALRPEEIKRAFELGDEMYYRFMRGESLPCSMSKGYAPATYQGYGIGIVKISDGIAKNRLPKGLRFNN